MSHDVYDYIENCERYESVGETPSKIYIKAPNEVLAHHLLASRVQQPGKLKGEFLQKSKNCNLNAVTASASSTNSNYILTF